jgi:hypothetical protein
LAERPEDLAQQWQQLCKWFKAKAAEAVASSRSNRAREIILVTVASFCRDEPPKTAAGLAGWKSFAERHVDLWETALLPDSDEIPTVVIPKRPDDKSAQ